MTARVLSAIRRHHPLAAARIAYVEQDGDRWAAFDDDDRRVAWGRIAWLGLRVVLHGVA